MPWDLGEPLDAVFSVRQRIASCDAVGLTETVHFLRQLASALTGEHPLDEVGIMAAMAETMERLERRLVIVERGTSTAPACAVGGGDRGDALRG